jgi:hypothetical protein
MAGRIENFAAQHHGHGDVAKLSHPEPRDGLLQRDDGGARPQRGGVRDAHDLAGKDWIGLNQPRQLRGVGGLLSRELGELCADPRQRRNRLRSVQGFAKIRARSLTVKRGQNNCGFETH